MKRKRKFESFFFRKEAEVEVLPREASRADFRRINPQKQISPALPACVRACVRVAVLEPSERERTKKSYETTKKTPLLSLIDSLSSQCTFCAQPDSDQGPYSKCSYPPTPGRRGRRGGGDSSSHLPPRTVQLQAHVASFLSGRVFAHAPTPKVLESTFQKCGESSTCANLLFFHGDNFSSPAFINH